MGGVSGSCGSRGVALLENVSILQAQEMLHHLAANELRESYTQKKCNHLLQQLDDTKVSLSLMERLLENSQVKCPVDVFLRLSLLHDRAEITSNNRNIARYNVLECYRVQLAVQSVGIERGKNTNSIGLLARNIAGGQCS